MNGCDFIVLTDNAGGVIRLTTASPESHYGIPVLRVEAADLHGDFGPADVIGQSGILAAAFVAWWGSEPGRTADELDKASLFLRQWPQGPQMRREVAHV